MGSQLQVGQCRMWRGCGHRWPPSALSPPPSDLCVGWKGPCLPFLSRAQNFPVIFQHKICFGIEDFLSNFFQTPDSKLLFLSQLLHQFRKKEKLFTCCFSPFSFLVQE